MLVLADLFSPWRLCSKFRRRPCAPRAGLLADGGRCIPSATSTVSASTTSSSSSSPSSSSSSSSASAEAAARNSSSPVSPSASGSASPTSWSSSISASAAQDDELSRLEYSISLLLNRLEQHPDEAASRLEDECVVCMSSKASMQTFPCCHMVLCRRCFIRTIQTALADRQLPLRCVICRSRVVRLRQKLARCRVVVRTQRVPPPQQTVATVGRS